MHYMSLPIQLEQNMEIFEASSYNISVRNWAGRGRITRSYTQGQYIAWLDVYF